MIMSSYYFKKKLPKTQKFTLSFILICILIIYSYFKGIEKVNKAHRDLIWEKIADSLNLSTTRLPVMTTEIPASSSSVEISTTSILVQTSDPLPEIEPETLITERSEPLNYHNYFLHHNNWTLGPSHEWKLTSKERSIISLKNDNNITNSLFKPFKLTKYSNKLNPFNMNYVLKPICHLENTQDKNLTIYVKSSLFTGYYRRQVIRQTWRGDYRVIFVLLAESPSGWGALKTLYKNGELSEELMKALRNNITSTAESDKDTDKIIEEPPPMLFNPFDDILLMTGFPDTWKTLSYKIISILQHAKYCQKQNKKVKNYSIDENDYLILRDAIIMVFYHDELHTS